MRNIILYMAVSVDGLIAADNDNVDWVGDDSWRSYLDFVESCDIVIVGKKTFELMSKDEFVEGVEYLVATNNADFDTGEFEKISINTVNDLPTDGRVGVVGGGDLNGRVAQLGCIDEIILDVEPVVLGEGIALFGSHEVEMQLRLKSSKLLGDNTVQNHYEVVK